MGGKRAEPGDAREEGEGKLSRAWHIIKTGTFLLANLIVVGRKAFVRRIKTNTCDYKWLI